jgi:hypothetical protein
MKPNDFTADGSANVVGTNRVVAAPKLYMGTNKFMPRKHLAEEKLDVLLISVESRQWKLLVSSV